MLHGSINGDLLWYQSSPFYKTGEKHRNLLTTSQSTLKSTCKRCHADRGIARCYLPNYMASHVRRNHLANLKYVSVLNARVQITWNIDPHNLDDSKTCSLRINRYAMADCCPQAQCSLRGGWVSWWSTATFDGSRTSTVWQVPLSYPDGKLCSHFSKTE